jgi:hypothetical protein
MNKNQQPAILPVPLIRRHFITVAMDKFNI